MHWTSVCLAWRHLKSRAKTEAQQMHFEVQNDPEHAGFADDDDQRGTKMVGLDALRKGALQNETDAVEEFEIADPAKEKPYTVAT